MSWQQTSVMEEKLEFVKLWESRVYVFTSLCDVFGISRVAGYDLINRYKKEGELALMDERWIFRKLIFVIV